MDQGHTPCGFFHHRFAQGSAPSNQAEGYINRIRCQIFDNRRRKGYDGGRSGSKQFCCHRYSGDVDTRERPRGFSAYQEPEGRVPRSENRQHAPAIQTHVRSRPCRGSQEQRDYRLGRNQRLQGPEHARLFREKLLPCRIARKDNYHRRRHGCEPLLAQYAHPDARSQPYALQAAAARKTITAQPSASPTPTRNPRTHPWRSSAWKLVQSASAKRPGTSATT